MGPLQGGLKSVFILNNTNVLIADRYCFFLQKWNTCRSAPPPVYLPFSRSELSTHIRFPRINQVPRINLQQNLVKCPLLGLTIPHTQPHFEVILYSIQVSLGLPKPQGIASGFIWDSSRMPRDIDEGYLKVLLHPHFHHSPFTGYWSDGTGCPSYNDSLVDAVQMPPSRQAPH